MELTKKLLAQRLRVQLLDASTSVDLRLLVANARVRWAERSRMTTKPARISTNASFGATATSSAPTRMALTRALARPATT